MAALKQEIGDGMDWTALEHILEGEWDEDEWERVVGTMLNEAADRVSAKADVWTMLIDQEDAGKPTFDDLDDAPYDEDEGGYEAYAYGPNGGDVFADEPMEDDEDAPINMASAFASARSIADGPGRRFPR